MTKKVLYLQGVQLGRLYRREENTGIAEGLLKGLVGVAKNGGFDEVWIQTEDLSNYKRLRDKLIAVFKFMGAEPVKESELKSLDYRDLPRNHYASPQGRKLLKLKIK